MSHIVEAKTSIKHPNLQLLNEAVQIVAGFYEGGRVEDYYLNFNERRIDTPLALFTPTIRRGIAVIVKESGELVFTGDSWGYRNAYETAQQQIIQTYVALVTRQSLIQMGFATSAQDGEEGQILLTGVSQYA